MLSKIIAYSVKNKFIVFLGTLGVIGFGIYALSHIPIGAVPDITNNQVQVITVSRNLSTQDIEQFITYPVELEMVNLPGVKEIRSISKFGLSVVTIVFEDDMGTYLPRQLIAEKIKLASEKIPEGFGMPEMGPITTGLGEIYQYILDVRPGYEHLYSTTELRTIQDWIVKRQLSGIPGVVEVNTWGGYLKQYEVALSTDKLLSLDITASDVFTALERNNDVAGGGYIEKNNEAYFIRGEGLVGSLRDLAEIVVVNRDGLPIRISDIGEVRYGHAPRFGAITANGEGEKVLGQVMMLKGADSRRVIDAVRERVAEISGSLPEGVYINPFLDRSTLIGKTTFTIEENLVLGCLIVIFVVVLLLGNFRSGLVIASVIPLCLLFAISLMYIFGIDANLMSLGAIDFGIIIDGAVIIVEFIAFQITTRSAELANLKNSELREQKDKITIESVNKMMSSAIFGQLIILIVFIPILSLGGVEGKMFRPMALVFGFAIIGAMIFCLTYVPAVSSFFLKPYRISGKSISGKLVGFMERIYQKTVNWAFGHKKMVLGSAVALLALAVLTFSRMGGEFVPTLDEGDFVIQPVLKTGTSLSKTIEVMTNIERILKENFPEVDQVVTRIGAAEIPTDPMSMEECDVIVTLKPKKEWVTADTKDGLATRFKEALSVIPGMELEFTQPIEMRFNELVTGVRADIAIKVFGEDLAVLASKGNEIKSLISDVEGASDIIVEKIEGLPQMKVAFDRDKIARYGMNIADVNEMITMGFAGLTVGNVFEGERRFDMAVRLNEANRRGLHDLTDLYIDLPDGGKVPLSELAEITLDKGAAKIARDNTRRRVVVGVNVRDRDLQSVVDDIQQRLDANLRLPVGYSMTYGGQFENLQSAKARLWVVVPLALVLIVILLYFAFNSMRDVAIIYTAIPLASVGGVFLLWARDMPFSISAGVGFIALFGIAVLNGIVLIEHFKELQQHPYDSLENLVKQGTKDRLRAVLLTASAAAMGFLPMAISTNAGAEVQRPLATVVIGGLISATLLTLVVLPILYVTFNPPGRKFAKGRKRVSGNKRALIIWPVMLIATCAMAQEAPVTLGDLVASALENNSGLKAQELEVARSKAMIGTAFDFDKTQVYYHYDENNLTLDNEALRVYGLQQDFLFPTVYFAGKKMYKAGLDLSSDRYGIMKKRVAREVTAAYYKWSYAVEKEQLLVRLDSLYRNFSEMAQRRFELGETNYLEKITSLSKRRQIAIRAQEAEKMTRAAMTRLMKEVQSDSVLEVGRSPLHRVALQENDLADSPEIRYQLDNINLAEAQHGYERQRYLPDLGLQYFQGYAPSLNGSLNGFQLGLKIPLLFGGKASRVKDAKIATEQAHEQLRDYSIRLRAHRDELEKQLQAYDEALSYYEQEGTELSDEILKMAEISYRNGELDFFQFIQSIENAYEVKLDYLYNLDRYNQTAIQINYLSIP